MSMKAEASKKGSAINPVLSLLKLEVEIATENSLRAFSPSCKSHTSLCTASLHEGMGALKVSLRHLRKNKSYPGKSEEPMPTFLHREMGSRRDPAAGVR